MVPGAQEGAYQTSTGLNSRPLTQCAVLPAWVVAPAADAAGLPVATEAPGEAGAAVPDVAEIPVVVVVAGEPPEVEAPVAPTPAVPNATVLLGAVDGAMEMIRAWMASRARIGQNRSSRLRLTGSPLTSAYAALATAWGNDSRVTFWRTIQPEGVEKAQWIGRQG